MELIDFQSLNQRRAAIAKDFSLAKPFRYTVFEGFFKPAAAEQILERYPSIGDGKWDGTTYVDQKNKFQKTQFDGDPVLGQAFRELNSPQFLAWLEETTGIHDLTGDPDLFGGGLHQSIAGAFLNVHVDYNIHPLTQLHRRLNVLIYMNKNWKDQYEGHLELWDLSANRKILLAKISPQFNRCVIFETNEISYHGHPKPLKTPPEVNRKSIATYYYTKDRPGHEMAKEHNTIYVNTEGVGGQVKRVASGWKAFLERIKGK
jgi:Rps23 Pro-64 3,4-dihydroxylase Tpa1-like proline 4-hydroxylase